MDADPTDDRVLELLRKLVEAGEYRDDLPTLDDVQLDPTVAELGGLAGLGDLVVTHFRGGEVVRWGGPGSAPPRRFVPRGSAEHREAKAAGRMAPMPVLEPARADAVGRAEQQLGAAFPPLLRRLYLEVADGGFGPGYGVLPLERDPRGDPRHLPGQLRDGLWPLCDWGCAVVSLVDCRDATGRMWAFDPNPGAPEEDEVFPEDITLAQWLHRWASGELRQPALVHDPSGGGWRGATQAEKARWSPEVDDD